MIWGLRFQTDKEKEMWHTKGIISRVYFSGFLLVLLGLFLGLWFFLFAEQYSWYQNIAIVIVSILIIGGILGVSWSPWAIKQGYKK